jgi:hypothetical protein
MTKDEKDLLGNSARGDAASFGDNERNIPCMVIGGQAVLLYGEPRLTRIIDITVGIGIDQLDRLEEAASSAGLVPIPSDPRAFARSTMVYPCSDTASGIRVDFIMSFLEYELGPISRGKTVRIGRTDVTFASPEDLIVHKMVAGRPRDLEDVRSILLKNAGLDVPFIAKRLSEFDRTQGGDAKSRFREIVKRIPKRPRPK